MKIAHLTSFGGNIGDKLHINGIRNKIKEEFSLSNKDLIFTNIELRLFYQNIRQRSFNDEFVSQVNQHDTLIIGGGGFFDINIEQSSTGVTIDFNERILEKIKIPIIFYGLGCNQLSPQEHLKRIDFENLLITFLKKIRYSSQLETMAHMK